MLHFNPSLLTLEEACCFNLTTPRLPCVATSIRWVSDAYFTVELMTRLADPSQSDVDKSVSTTTGTGAGSRWKSQPQQPLRPVVIGVELSAVTVHGLLPNVHILVGQCLNELAQLSSSSLGSSQHIHHNTAPLPVTLLAEHFSRFPLTGKGDLLFPIVQKRTSQQCPPAALTQPLTPAFGVAPQTTTIHYVSLQQELLRRGIGSVTMARYPNRRHITIVEGTPHPLSENCLSPSSVPIPTSPPTILRNLIQFEGKVINILRGDVFVVELTSNVTEMKLRKNREKSNSNASCTINRGQQSGEEDDEGFTNKWPRIVNASSSALSNTRYTAVVHLASVRCPNAYDGALYAPADGIEGLTMDRLRLHYQQQSISPAIGSESAVGKIGLSSEQRPSSPSLAPLPLHPACINGMPYDGLAALRFSQRTLLGATVSCHCVSFVPSDKDLSNNTQESFYEQQEHYVGTVDVVVASAATNPVVAPIVEAYRQRQAAAMTSNNKRQQLPSHYSQSQDAQQQDEHDDKLVASTVSVAFMLFDMGLAKILAAPEGPSPTAAPAGRLSSSPSSSSASFSSPLWTEYTLLLALMDAIIEDERRLSHAMLLMGQHGASKREEEGGSLLGSNDGNGNSTQQGTAAADALSLYTSLPPSLLQQHQRFCWAADPLQTHSVMEAGTQRPWPWGQHRLAVAVEDLHGFGGGEGAVGRRWLNERHLEKSLRERESQAVAEHVTFLLHRSHAHNCKQLVMSAAAAAATTSSPSNTHSSSSTPPPVCVPNAIHASLHRFYFEADGMLPRSPQQHQPSQPPPIIDKVLPFVETYVASLCKALTSDTGCTVTATASEALLPPSQCDGTTADPATPLIRRMQQIFGCADNNKDNSTSPSRVDGQAATIASAFVVEKPPIASSTASSFSSSSVSSPVRGGPLFWAVVKALAVRCVVNGPRYQAVLARLLSGVSNGVRGGGGGEDDAVAAAAVTALLEAIGVIGTTAESLLREDSDDTGITDNECAEAELSTALLASSCDGLGPLRRIVTSPHTSSLLESAISPLLRALDAHGVDLKLFDIPSGPAPTSPPSVLCTSTTAAGHEKDPSSVKSSSSSSSPSPFRPYLQQVTHRLLVAAARALLHSAWYPTRAPPSSLHTKKSTALHHCLRQRMIAPQMVPLKTIVSLGEVVATGKLMKGFVSNATVEVIMPSSVESQSQLQKQSSPCTSSSSSFILNVMVEFTAFLDQNNLLTDTLMGLGGAASEEALLLMGLGGNNNNTAALLRAARDKGEIVVLPLCSAANYVCAVPMSLQKQFLYGRRPHSSSSTSAAAAYHQQQQHISASSSAAAAMPLEYLTVHPFKHHVPGFTFGYDPLLSGVALEDVTVKLSVVPIASLSMAELGTMIHELVCDYKAAGGSFSTSDGGGGGDGFGNVNQLVSTLLGASRRRKTDESPKLLNHDGDYDEAEENDNLLSSGGRQNRSNEHDGSSRTATTAAVDDPLFAIANSLFAEQYLDYEPHHIDVPPNIISSAVARGGGGSAAMIPLSLDNPPQMACTFFIVDVKVSYFGKAVDDAAMIGGGGGGLNDDAEENDDDNENDSEEDGDILPSSPSSSAPFAPQSASPSSFEITKQMIFFVYDEAATTNALLDQIDRAKGEENAETDGNNNGEGYTNNNGHVSVLAPQPQQQRINSIVALRGDWTEDKLRRKLTTEMKNAANGGGSGQQQSGNRYRKGGGDTASVTVREVIVDTSEMELQTVGSAAARRGDGDDQSPADLIGGGGAAANNTPKHTIDNAADGGVGGGAAALSTPHSTQTNHLLSAGNNASVVSSAAAAAMIERQANNVLKSIGALMPSATLTVDKGSGGLLKAFAGNVLANATVSTVAPSDYLLLSSSSSLNVNGGPLVASAAPPPSLSSSSSSSASTVISHLMASSESLRQRIAQYEAFEERKVFASQAPIMTCVNVCFPLLVEYDDHSVAVGHNNDDVDIDDVGHHPLPLDDDALNALVQSHRQRVESALFASVLLKDAVLVPTSVVDDDPSLSRHRRQCLLGDVYVDGVGTVNCSNSTNSNGTPNSHSESLRDMLERLVTSTAEEDFAAPTPSPSSSYAAIDTIGTVLPYRHATHAVARAAVARQQQTAQSLAAELVSGLVVFDALNMSKAAHDTLGLKIGQMYDGKEEEEGTTSNANPSAAPSAVCCYQPAVEASVLLLKHHQKLRFIASSSSSSLAASEAVGAVKKEPLPGSGADAENALLPSSAPLSPPQEKKMASSLSVELPTTTELSLGRVKDSQTLLSSHIVDRRKALRFGCGGQKLTAAAGDTQSNNSGNNNGAGLNEDAPLSLPPANDGGDPHEHRDLPSAEEDAGLSAEEIQEEDIGDDSTVPLYYPSLGSLLHEETRGLLLASNDDDDDGDEAAAQRLMMMGQQEGPYAHLVQRWTGDAVFVNADDDDDSATLVSSGSHGTPSPHHHHRQSTYRFPTLYKQPFAALSVVPPPSSTPISTAARSGINSGGEANGGSSSMAMGQMMTQSDIDRTSLSMFSLSAQKLVALKKSLDGNGEGNQQQQQQALLPTAPNTTAPANAASAFHASYSTSDGVLTPFSAFPRMLFATHYDHHRGVMPKAAKEEARGFAHMDVLMQRMRFPRLPNVYKSGSWEGGGSSGGASAGPVGTLSRIDPIAMTRQVLMQAQQQQGSSNTNGNANKMSTASSSSLPFCSSDVIISSSAMLSSLMATVFFALPNCGMGSDLGEHVYREARLAAAAGPIASRRGRGGGDREEDNKEGPSADGTRGNVPLTMPTAVSFGLSVGGGQSGTAAAPSAAGVGNKAASSVAPSSIADNARLKTVVDAFKRSATTMKSSGVLEMILVPIPTNATNVAAPKKPSSTTTAAAAKPRNGGNGSPRTAAPAAAAADAARAFLVFGHIPSRVNTNMQSPTDTVPRKMPLRALIRMIADAGVATSMTEEENKAGRENKNAVAGNHVLIDNYNHQPMGQHGAVPSPPGNTSSSLPRRQMLQPRSKDTTSTIFEGFCKDLPFVMYRPSSNSGGDTDAGGTNSGSGRWCVLGAPLAAPPNHNTSSSSSSASSSSAVVVEYIPVRLPKSTDLYKLSSYGQVRRDDVYEVFMGKMGRSLDIVEYCKLLVQGRRRERRSGEGGGGRGGDDQCGKGVTRAVVPADGTFKVIGNAHEPLYMMYTHRRTLRCAIGLWWNVAFPLDCAGPAMLQADPFMRRVTERYRTAEAAAAGAAPFPCSPSSANPVEAAVRFADAEEASLKEMLFSSCEWLFWLIALRIQFFRGDGRLKASGSSSSLDASSSSDNGSSSGSDSDESSSDSQPNQSAAASSGANPLHLRTYVDVTASSVQRCIVVNVWEFTQVAHHNHNNHQAQSRSNGNDAAAADVGATASAARPNPPAPTISTDPADQHKHYGLENNVTNRMVTLSITLHAKAFAVVREAVERGAEAEIMRNQTKHQAPRGDQQQRGPITGGPNSPPSTAAATAVEDDQQRAADQFIGVGKRRWLFDRPPANLGSLLGRFGLVAGRSGGGGQNEGNCRGEGCHGIHEEDAGGVDTFPFIIEVTDSREY